MNLFQAEIKWIPTMSLKPDLVWFHGFVRYVFFLLREGAKTEFETEFNP
jgi:hypothetical protein